ncbi:MAG: serine/threonine-protein kinase, partial [Planctomycetota bacterium]
MQRFYAEIRATAQLMHPNIVTAFDAGETAGVHYLAMEYVEGQTLSQLVRQHGPMPLGDAISAIIDAAKGLAYAHRNGIVHRDVKPSNFIRTPEGIVKVLDLGLATIGKSREHHPEMQGKLVGTIEYMAPEQLQNAAVSDNRSDIYSLGATLYFLLTGRTPYTGEMLELAKAHRQLPPPDLFTARPDIDVRVNQVFRRMMATHVQQRYANMDELLEDLQAWEQRGAAPQWIADMGSTSGSETPTTGGYSTLSATLDVLGIDFGMQYAAAGRASPDGTINALSAGPEKRALKRLAVYGRPTNVVTGSEALKHRELKPHRVAHCLPLFVGSETVNRKITNRLCPPEALMALFAIRRRISPISASGG